MSRFILDRVEGDLAVLEVDGQSILVPTSALPPGAHEGSVLQLVYGAAPEVQADPSDPNLPVLRDPVPSPQMFAEDLDEEQQRLAEAEARLARLRALNADLPDEIEL